MNASRPILLIRLSSEIPTLLTKYSLQQYSNSNMSAKYKNYIGYTTLSRSNIQHLFSSPARGHRGLRPGPSYASCGWMRKPEGVQQQDRQTSCMRSCPPLGSSLNTATTFRHQQPYKWFHYFRILSK